MGYKIGFIEHERLTIEAFVIAPKRARYLELISNVRTRKKFIAELDAGLEFDRVKSHPVPTAKQDPKILRDKLESKGAPLTCWVISADADIDGREMKLLEALEIIQGNDCGTLVSCLPGRLAFYSAADKAGRLLLF